MSFEHDQILNNGRKKQIKRIPYGFFPVLATYQIKNEIIEKILLTRLKGYATF